MKTAHLNYLKKAINIAINLKDIADVPAQIAQLKGYRPPIYGLIRDIAGDRRFYSVTENTPFWHRYALASVHDFIESVSAHEWNNQALLISRKEEFLNSWYFNHVVPMTAAKEEEIELELQAGGWSIPATQTSVPDSGISISMPGTYYLDNDKIIDYTISNQQDDKHLRAGSDNNNADNELPAAIQNYAADTEQSGRGTDPGAEDDPHRAEATFMSKIDPTLRKLAKMIGRSGGTATTEIKGKFQHARRSDISGVTVGNDLGCLLPAELALLGHQSTEDLFYRKYCQKRLQIFSSSSSSTEQHIDNKGAILMCVDTSGSMSGEPEIMAKSLALAIAIIAQRERRPVFVINYSYTISFFILCNLERQRREFLRFLGHSYSGGNDENLLFRFLFRILPNHPRYSKFRQYFKNADLLVVSDFIWSSIDNENLQQINNARQSGLRVFTLEINYPQYTVDGAESDIADFFPKAYDFFYLADHRFRYNGISVKELKTTKKERHHGTKNETPGRNRIYTRKLRSRYDN